MRDAARGVLGTVVAFVGSLFFGVVLSFIAEAFEVPRSFKLLALWLPIGVCAVSVAFAVSRSRWIPNHPWVDVLSRIVVTIALYLLFIPMFGGWGLWAEDLGARARVYVRGR
jgi:uncharacterized membrane protein